MMDPLKDTPHKSHCTQRLRTAIKPEGVLWWRHVLTFTLQTDIRVDAILPNWGCVPLNAQQNITDHTNPYCPEASMLYGNSVTRRHPH